MKVRFLIFFLLSSNFILSQELNSEVIIDARQTGSENLQIFKTLESQLTEFINNTTWTDKSVRQNEKINCSFYLNITSYENDFFEGTIQIQSFRPVFNSSYNSPTYNFNDRNFTFNYQQFQNFTFNENQFENNLVSVIAFHIYIILGIDADTFKLNSGTSFFEQAQKILNFSQQKGFKGWGPADGLQSRYYLIDNILSNTYKEFRTCMYNYHLNGLDIMVTQSKKAKQEIVNSILLLDQMYKRRPNSYILRIFFDSKSDEILDIFSGGPKIPITNLISTLTKIAPNHSDKWRNISF
ncbi:MAG: DUF4835 domain-containing protein [Flavobacteriaceae bacterium]|nr:DUF4835 domain-containing protein [Flavobacteriaceae bacterium]